MNIIHLTLPQQCYPNYFTKQVHYSILGKTPDQVSQLSTQLQHYIIPVNVKVTTKKRLKKQIEQDFGRLMISNFGI